MLMEDLANAFEEFSEDMEKWYREVSGSLDKVLGNGKPSETMKC